MRKIKRIEIVSLKEDIFYGNIVAEVNGQETNVDSRPSDAIALAVRAHVPILVDESVIQNAGITPETDVEGSGAARLQKAKGRLGRLPRLARSTPNACRSSKIFSGNLTWTSWTRTSPMAKTKIKATTNPISQPSRISPKNPRRNDRVPSS